MFINSLRLIRKFSLFFCCLFFVIGVVACGKRRPPVPPSQSPVLNSVTAAQQGSRIILKIAPPASQRTVKQVNIYRLNELSSSPLFLSEDDFASRSTLIASIDKAANNNAKDLFYTDALSTFTPSTRLRYSVRFIFEDDRQSAFSSFAIIEPTLQVPLAPIALNAEVKQEAVALSWQKPSANLDASTPANIVGYNIYRTSSKQNESAVKLNPAPQSDMDFADKSFQFGEEYKYFVRAVTVSANGVPIESLDSNVVAVAPRDTFAPAAPQGVTIAAAPGRLSLFFAANSEQDVAGYNIYRSTDEKTPPAQWQKLNQTPLAATTYQDVTVEAGQKYFYYITAVDNAGNTSAPSETVSETAP